VCRFGSEYADAHINVVTHGAEERIPVHRAILSVRSIFFLTAFADGAVVVRVVGFHRSVVENVLHYAYTGCMRCAELTLAETYDTYAAARRICVVPLCAAIESHLYDRLDTHGLNGPLMNSGILQRLKAERRPLPVTDIISIAHFALAHAGNNLTQSWYGTPQYMARVYARAVAVRESFGRQARVHLHLVGERDGRTTPA
jgi:hypothetical protein